MAGLRKINQDDLRNHNLSVILDAMLCAKAPMSRADLAKETGLTKATMSLLVSMLLEAGVVGEGDPVVASSGRPSTPLRLRGGRVAGIGLQVNTDGYGCLALDINGDTLGRAWVDADMTAADPQEVFAKLDAMARPLEERLARRGCTVAGAGLALPGIVVGDRLLAARNLGWNDVDLAGFDVVRRLGAVPGNEAKMAAIAQIPGYATERAGFLDAVDRRDSFIYISTDIGIGGAVVRDGEVVRGSRGFAGEIGHLSVALDGPRCTCGRRGCLEMYAGRRAMVEAAGIAGGDGATTLESAERLLDGWRSGDGRATAVVARAVDALVSAVASTVNVIDVDTVVLGGLWTHLGDELPAEIERRLRDEVVGPPSMAVKVYAAQVGENPSLYGAAERGLRRFIDDPLRFVGD